MPRGARLDWPRSLHYVMVRGIERMAIVVDDEDRLDFLRRIGMAADATGTVIKARSSRSRFFTTGNGSTRH